MQHGAYQSVVARQHLLPNDKLALRAAHAGGGEHVVHRLAYRLLSLVADHAGAHFAHKAHDVGFDDLTVGILRVKVHRQIVGVLDVSRVLAEL